MRDRQHEERHEIAGIQYGTCRNEVAGDADEEIRHVLARGEDAGASIHEPGRADDGADDPLHDPLAAELAAAEGVVSRERRIGAA